MKFKKNIFLFLVFLSGAGLIYGEEDNKNLRWNGKLRIRALHYGGENEVNSYLTGAGFKSVTYQDLFFRNTFLFNAASDIQIETIFDTYSVFGEGDGQIDKSDLGFQIRNLLIRWTTSALRLEAGYIPFTMPNGFILATNGAGAKLTFLFLDETLSPYVYWIKSYDNSKVNTGGGIGRNDFRDSDIYISGLKYKGISDVTLDAYYIYAHDRDSINGSASRLHWTGVNAQMYFERIIAQIDIIYNFGSIDTTNTAIESALAAFNGAYKFNGWRFTLFGEIISGDLLSSRGDDFQSIKGSHGVSNIAVDNSGGLSIISGGGASGLVLGGAGVKVLMPSWSLDVIYSHYRPLSDRMYAFGNELDVNASIRLRENAEFNINSGVFLPEREFADYTGQTTDNTKPIYEIIAAITVKY